MELLARYAGYQELLDHFVRLLRALPLEDSAWHALIGDVVAVHESPLDWVEPKQRHYVKDRAASLLCLLLTRYRPVRATISGDIPEPSLAWLVAQDDATVARFCWQLLAWPSRNTTAISQLEDHGRLRGDLARHHLELAVSIHDEAQRMLSWPRMRWKLVDWQRDTAPYFRALKYSSCLVRAVAAHALGQLYYGCATQGRKIAPPLAELLSQMAALERDTPGIAGPFLCGFHFNSSPLTQLWSGIDMGTWILKTLRESQQEPETPHCLSLAFYAHEFFDKDADAIEAMLTMGRRGLAVYTATQSPEHLEAIRPTLERMASGEDPEIAQAIQTYLAKPSHHHGTQFLTKPAFGRTNYS